VRFLFPYIALRYLVISVANLALYMGCAATASTTAEPADQASTSTTLMSFVTIPCNSTRQRGLRGSASVFGSGFFREI